MFIIYLVYFILKCVLFIDYYYIQISHQDQFESNLCLKTFDKMDDAFILMDKTTRAVILSNKKTNQFFRSFYDESKPPICLDEILSVKMLSDYLGGSKVKFSIE